MLGTYFAIILLMFIVMIVVTCTREDFLIKVAQEIIVFWVDMVVPFIFGQLIVHVLGCVPMDQRRDEGNHTEHGNSE